MAKIKKITKKNGETVHRCYINVTLNGKMHRENKQFSTKVLAQAWGEKRLKELEHESIHGQQNNKPIKTILENYIKQFGKNYGRTKNYDLARLLHYPIADISADKLTAKHIIIHCIERNKTAKPQTVLNDVIWLRTALRTMSAVDGFEFQQGVFDNAMTILKQEKLVGRSAERMRLPTHHELFALSRYFKKSRSSLPMFDLMWFAYFSSRRLSEITRLEWADNNDAKKTGRVKDVKHPRFKDGNHLRFKYDACAFKLVQRQPKTHRYIFPYNSKTIGTNFERACKRLNIHDLHFHDLRHAATSRLFILGYSIEQVQLFTLHENWKTLARYTHLKPEDI